MRRERTRRVQRRTELYRNRHRLRARVLECFELPRALRGRSALPAPLRGRIELRLHELFRRNGPLRIDHGLQSRVSLERDQDRVPLLPRGRPLRTCSSWSPARRASLAPLGARSRGRAKPRAIRALFVRLQPKCEPRRKERHPSFVRLLRTRGAAGGTFSGPSALPEFLFSVQHFELREQCAVAWTCIGQSGTKSF
jgi:hypothetical protein